MNSSLLFRGSIKLVHKMCHFRNVTRYIMSYMAYFIGTSKAEIKSNNKHILIEASSSGKLGHLGHGFILLHKSAGIMEVVI